MEELSDCVYHYMTRGIYPGWYKDHQLLVECGIARFISEGSEVVVREPMALVSIVRYFEHERHTLEHSTRTRVQSNPGQGLEEAVLLSFTKTFRGEGTLLENVFEFYGGTPEWARQEATIVISKANGEVEPFDILNGEPVIPSAGVAFYAKGPSDVKRWIQSKQFGWCIPGPLMGPDLMAWLQLKDKRMLLLLIQTKARLKGKETTDTVFTDVTSSAIRSLIPAEFFVSDASTYTK
jgi:hypothetical protein